jgi:uncharacterized protein (DUF488 family)
VEIYTIGFTKKSAATFFGALKQARIARLVDIRLNNTSQLAGFTKRDDLAYLLREICDAAYHHEPMLAPNQELFDRYKKAKGSWEEYEREFLHLMAERRIETVLDRTLFHVPTVLLCTEPTPERCHRRLVVEYLQQAWGDLTPIHL